MINVPQLNVDVEMDLSIQTLLKIVMEVGKRNAQCEGPVFQTFVNVCQRHRQKEHERVEW